MLKNQWRAHATKIFSRTLVLQLADLIEQDNLDQVAKAKDDKKALENLRRQFRYIAAQKLSRLSLLGWTRNEIYLLLRYIPSAQVIDQILSFQPKANTLNLKYFTRENIIKALRKGWSIPTLFEVAERFEHLALEEDPEFANFNKLFTYPGLDDEHLKQLVNILVQLKYHEIDVTQDQLMRYFNVNRPLSEDLKNLYHALILVKDKNLDLTIGDFIKGIIDGRMPKNLALTYSKIRDNDLAISKVKYLTMGLEQSTIDKVVGLMILAKKHDLVLDFENLLKQISAGNNVFDVIKLLLKLNENGFKDIDFGYLTKLALLKVDLNLVLPAFIYARDNGLYDRFKQAIDRILPLRNKIAEQFNLLNLARSLHIGQQFGVKDEQIINDYVSGIDVWSILDLVKYAHSKGIDNLSYGVAKILAKNGLDNLKDIIYKTLNPFELESDYIYVTTKDNIEIKVKLIVLVTYNLANFFKGTDQEYLMRLIKAVFIDEVQKQYDHDQIVKNIDKISKNIIRRLTGKTENEEEDDSKFLAVNKFIPHKVIIPKIEFVRDTFKEIDKEKHDYNVQKEMVDLELERLRAEIKIKEAWAQSKDLRYLILKDEELTPRRPLRPNEEEEE